MPKSEKLATGDVLGGAIRELGTNATIRVEHGAGNWARAES